MRKVAALVAIMVVSCVADTDQTGVSLQAIQEGECAIDFADCRAADGADLELCRDAYHECMGAAAGSGEATGDGDGPAEGAGDGECDGDGDGPAEGTGDGEGDAEGPAEGSGDGEGDADGPAEGSGDGVGAGEGESAEQGGICRAEYDGCRAEGGTEIECEELRFECVFALCQSEFDGCRADGDSERECTGALGQCMRGSA